MQTAIIETEVEPGFVYATKEKTFFFATIGSGIVITLYDRVKKIGGICYFVYPLRKNKKDSNPMFACPALVGLLNMFIEFECDFRNVEACIIGGAENKMHPYYKPQLAAKNIKVAKELLDIKNIHIDVVDVGGTNRGRKMIFNSYTGEILIARLNNIKKETWYPVIER